MAKHIAVDLDGTLAHYDRSQRNGEIGDPINDMVQRVKEWMQQGDIVWIFTARLSGDDYAEQYSRISLWLERQGIGDCEITNVKRREFAEFWDDRAFRVYRNEGIVCRYCSIGSASRGRPLQEIEDTAD
jgi:hypothetical protein